ncbi:MAG: hypothetical protein JWM02_3680 [Frankiales bacterium]|nr:hypothetical protein [Frankiales bacterium]
MTDSPGRTHSLECEAETGGYDGMFGLYCQLPEGHEELHLDGDIEWRRLSDTKEDPND